MRYILIAFLLTLSSAAHAGLVTVYFDDATWEIEGVTTVNMVGPVGDYTVFGDIAYYPPSVPPSDDFVGTWSGVSYPTDPLEQPVTVTGCRLSRLAAQDDGDVLVHVDCRDGIFFNGFDPI